MIRDGWLSSQTEAFNKHLNMSQRDLRSFDDNLLNFSLECYNSYNVAMGFGFDRQAFRRISIYEVAMSRLWVLFDNGDITLDEKKKGEEYLKNSDTYKTHRMLDSEELTYEMGDDDSDGWTNAETRRFVTRFRLTGEESSFKTDLAANKLELDMMSSIAEETRKINFYEIAMSYLTKLSLGEKYISYTDKNVVADALYNSPFYKKYEIILRDQTWETETKLEAKLETNQKKETKLMLKIETKHFVNDRDVTKLEVEEKIALIASTERQIEKLQLISVKSKLVLAEIEKTEIFLAKIIELFDATL